MRMIRFGKTISTVVFALLAPFSSASESGQLVIPSGDHLVTSCSPGLRGNRTCETLRVPAAIGSVKQVLQGDFIINSPLSFIAVSTKNTSLCALRDGSNNLICALINPPLTADIKLSRIETEDGKVGLLFDPSSDLSKYDSQVKAGRFLAGLVHAQKIITRQLAKNSKGKATQAPGGVTTNLVDTGGSCADDEEGGTLCGTSGSDNGGGGYGGGGSGSGSGSGSGDGCVYGPITVCNVPPPPPPDVPTTPPTPPLSMCQIFGINCPSEPAPLPPKYYTVEERKQQCMADYDLDIEECSAYYGAYGSATYRTCTERASSRLSTCLRNAEGK